jgi:hypothetical protein
LERELYGCAITGLPVGSIFNVEFFMILI